MSVLESSEATDG